MRNKSEMLDRTGMAGEKIRVRERRAVPRRTARTVLAAVAGMAAILAIIAVVLAPASETGATPGKTGGNCGNCHPVTATSFLTVTGFPSQYIPGQVYTITVTIADANGVSVGENSFDMILATGGGSVVGVDPYVKNVSSVQVATDQAVSTTVAQWTVKWTAPMSGDISVDTWAVYGTGAGMNSPYEHITTSVTAGAIPEFSVVLLPVAGVAVALVLVSRASKRRAKK